jgi:sugar O-acyltransferase (sialic acid O-acetyltransferase NeuD family)
MTLGQMSAESKRITLIGGGGHALVVAATAIEAGFAVAGYFDDDRGAVLGARMGVPWLGTLEQAGRGVAVIVAVGDLKRRRSLIDRLGSVDVVSVCAPRSCAAGARVGRGVLVAAGAVVQAFVEVGDHAIINTGAIVEHECRIGANAHVAPGAVLGGRVRVGADTLVGLGSRVLPGVQIGAGCVIGAGSVVLRDVADGEKVAGVPARAL